MPYDLIFIINKKQKNKIIKNKKYLKKKIIIEYYLCGCSLYRKNDEFV